MRNDGEGAGDYRGRAGCGHPALQCIDFTALCVCVALGAPKTKVGNRLACSVVTMLSEVNLHGGTVKTVPYEQKLYCLRYPRAMPSP